MDSDTFLARKNCSEARFTQFALQFIVIVQRDLECVAVGCVCTSQAFVHRFEILRSSGAHRFLQTLPCSEMCFGELLCCHDF